jgi:SAM-dependent methyltransferase
MGRDEKGGIEAFNRDVVLNEGYRYTTRARLSSMLANRRLTEAALGIVDWRGKRVVDIGCGDGSYTVELFDAAGPLEIIGIDPASEAVKLAERKVVGRPITYLALNGRALPFPDKSFDIAHLRGVLHHAEQPKELLREAMRVSRCAVIIEPNGYNPILKLIERFSKYHIEHGEKSYSPDLLHRWIDSCGGKVLSRRYAGLVPFFCPDPVARTLKFFEPAVESIPFLNALTCAVYVALIDCSELPPLGID